jgi:hypothetical protein
MEVIECEERALASEGVAPCTLMMEKIWDSKKFWFFCALRMPGLSNLACSQCSGRTLLIPYLIKSSPIHWIIDTDKFIATKIADRQD